MEKGKQEANARLCEARNRSHQPNKPWHTGKLSSGM